MSRSLGSLDIGDKPVITATFTNAAGAVTDPSTVIFLLQDSALTETSYTYGIAAEVTKTSTGVYAFTLPTIALSGKYKVRAKATAGLITAGECEFGVNLTRFTNP